MTRRQFEASVIRNLMAPAASWTLSPGTTWTRRRHRSERVSRAGRRAPGVHLAATELAGRQAEIATPPRARNDLVLLYLHGGGFTMGSAHTHRSLVTRLAARMRVTTWSVDYRLAPEAPFPAALDDCVAAYRALLQAGHSRIVVAGESAGGGLTASLALTARDQGFPPPVALGLLCPAVDLTEAALDRMVDTRREPLLSVRVLREMFGDYAGTHDRTDPLVSPLYGDLSGLPPMVLHSSADDLLGEQATAYATAVRETGGSIDHVHYPDRWHVFHLLAGVWPDATDALDDFADRLTKAAT